MAESAGARTSGRRTLLFQLLRIVPVALFVALFARLVHRADWGRALDALTKLTVLQMLAIGGLVVARQLLDATPLTQFVGGLGLPRAVVNEAAGRLVATVAPAPSDLVLRMRMFRSWGVDPVLGSAGLALTSIVQYVGRFTAPVVGLVVFVLWYGWEAIYVWSAVGGAVIAAVLMALLLAVSRGERRAFAIGRRCGLIVRRVSRIQVDADSWGARAAQLQQATRSGLAERLTAAIAGIAALYVVDLMILVLAFRFVGLSSSGAAAPAIVAAFLCAYPLSALPLAGLGFLDAAAISLLGPDNELADQQAVAAFIVWRVASLLIPLALGAVTLLHWRYFRNQHDD